MEVIDYLAEVKKPTGRKYPVKESTKERKEGKQERINRLWGLLTKSPMGL